jgi:hypothetical protein
MHGFEDGACGADGHHQREELARSILQEREEVSAGMAVL